ncbi:hypothetical protein C0992_001695, partial [Termitomyces sp. T32_za158]
VRTLHRPKETSNHPIPRNALLPNGTSPRLEPRSPSPLRQLPRRLARTPQNNHHSGQLHCLPAGPPPLPHSSTHRILSL